MDLDFLESLTFAPEDFSETSDCLDLDTLLAFLVMDRSSSLMLEDLYSVRDLSVLLG